MGPQFDSRLFVSLFLAALILSPHSTAATWAYGSEERRLRPSPVSGTTGTLLGNEDNDANLSSSAAECPIPDAKQPHAFFRGTSAEYDFPLNRRPVTVTVISGALLRR